jgi:hypothetical protein
VNTGKYFVAFEPPLPFGELCGGFVMRERSKKYRLENPEKPRYVKYMYYTCKKTKNLQIVFRNFINI